MRQNGTGSQGGRTAGARSAGAQRRRAQAKPVERTDGTTAQVQFPKPSPRGSAASAEKSNARIQTHAGGADWSRLLREGVMVSLVIKRYRGYVKLEFSDIGLDMDGEVSDILADYIQPGRKLLLPAQIDKQLKSIETSARQNLAACSFECNALGMTGRFVPKTKYRDFKRANQEHMERFYAIRDEFATGYDDIVRRVREEYDALARALYKQRHPRASKVPEDYVKAFTDRVMSGMPGKDEIVGSFVYRTVLARVPDYVIEQAPAPKKRTSGAFSNPADEIDYDVAASQSEGNASMLNDFVSAITDKVREMAFDGATTVISSIDKNGGKLVGRASIKAHSLIDELSKMNFYGDGELGALVEDFRNALAVGDSGRDVDEVHESACVLRDWGDGIDAAERARRSAVRERERKAESAAAATTDGTARADGVGKRGNGNGKIPDDGKNVAGKARGAVKVPLPKKASRRQIKSRT